MKIIRLTTFLDFGGIERKMENLSFWQDEHEWVFVAIHKTGAAGDVIEQNGKRVICLGLTYKIPNLKTIWNLYKLFKLEKPDVIHSAGAEANFHALIAAHLAGIKIKVAEEIGIPIHSKKARFLFKYIYNLADFVIGESEIVVKNLEANYSVPKTKLKKIYNFINAPTLKPFNKSSNEEFTIISVSRLAEKKNFDLALNVIQKLLLGGLKLKYLIIGEGPERVKLENKVKELQISDHVSFMGFKADPKPFLQQADLFLLTSNHEGFSNSLLEAMYYKTPSLSTRVGGSEDIIVDNLNGWLIEINDERGLYDAIIHIMSLPLSNLMEVADHAHKSVIDNFTLKHHMLQTYKLYEYA